MGSSARYHPIAESLWNDRKLEGTPFEEKGFFAFLCSNTRQRPSGIYRATDGQISADTEIPLRRVVFYLSDLSKRRLIVRDGAWIFIRNYFKRQPKQERLLLGVESDVKSCDSITILQAFSEQYPTLNRWSMDRLETISRPMNGFVPSDTDTNHIQIQTKENICDAGDGLLTVNPTSLNGLKETAIGILVWLNTKAGRNYETKPPKADTNLAFILDRLKEGYQDWQLRAVVSRKVREWKNDPKMGKYLRPATLFNREKFSQYVGELPPPESEVTDGMPGVQPPNAGNEVQGLRMDQSRKSGKQHEGKCSEH